MHGLSTHMLLLLHSPFMLSVVKMLLKGEVGGRALVMEITLLIMEKLWNCVFEFLWEPCLGFLKKTGMHMRESRKFCQRGSNFEAFLAHQSRRLRVSL